MFSSRASAVLATLGRAADRLGNRLGSVGIGAFAWPPVIGVGLGVGLLSLFEPAFTHGISKRQASTEWLRPSLTAGALGTAAVVLFALLLALLVRRRDAERSLGDLYNLNLRRVAFLAALPLVVTLREPLEVTHAWIVLGFAAVAGVLAAYSVYHSISDAAAPEARRWRRWLPRVVLVLLMVAYVCTAGYLSIANHLNFNTGRSDLGYYMSIFRQSSQGIPLGCSLCGNGTHLTGHFDPILILLSPIYLIYPFAETILILQTLWLASGALPVYLVARYHLKRSGSALAFACAYLAYPALHGVNLFDFHSLALCTPIFIWLLYFLQTGRTRAYYVTLPFLLLVREDISVALCLVGLYAAFSKVPGRARLGFVTMLVSACYYVIAKAVFMGHIDPLNTSAAGTGGYSGAYAELIPPGKSIGGLIGTLLGDPVYVITHVFTEEKLDYVAKLLVPLLALPLVARERMLLLYGAAFTLLGSVPFLHSIHFQYSSVVIPFMFVLAIAALGRIRSEGFLVTVRSPERLARGLSMGVLVCTLLCSWKFGGFVPNGSFHGGFRPLARQVSAGAISLDVWIRKFARSLPRGEKVAASTRIIPHLGCVTNVYMIDDRQKANYVVAGLKNPIIAKIVRADQAAGELALIDRLGDTAIYRTKYRKVPGVVVPSAPAKAIDE